MRMDRVKPDALFLHVDQQPPRWWGDGPQEHEALPSVYIAPGERIQHLDLRFLVGLDVHLVAPSYHRMVEALYACRQAGAKRVIAVTHDTNLQRVTYLLDTETSYQWQMQES